MNATGGIAATLLLTSVAFCGVMAGFTILFLTVLSVYGFETMVASGLALILTAVVFS